jgi:tRNA (guanosine-2'-O-)-methyltransferase
VDQTVDGFTRARLVWADQFQVGGLAGVGVEEVLTELAPHLTDERRARLEQVVDGRSLHLVPVLENIYDRGNVSAVMRSAEAFGFLQMHLVDRPGARFKAANRVTRGAEKWLDVHQATSPQEAVGELNARGYQVWATDLATTHSIDDLDWTRPTAVVLGNEKDGVSPEMRGLVDGCFRIPMAGFSQSFNISVAAALIFYHAHLEARRLGPEARLSSAQRRQVLANYYLRCFDNPEAVLRLKRERG